MATLHARCFRVPRPFTEAEFTAFRDDPACFFVTDKAGFALGRSAADEAELITLAVEPARRRQGIGRALLVNFEAEAASRGASRIFLEVSAGNSAASTLYAQAGYTHSGTRAAYYRQANGTREDAVLMEKLLDLPGPP